MIGALGNLFLIYLPLGFLKALRAILRIFILPFWKIDKILPNSGTIIDIGCGDGCLTNYLALRSKRRTLIGVDKSTKRINWVEKTSIGRKNIKFISANIVTMKLPKGDRYLLVDVLHHIPFTFQEKILQKLVTNMGKNSMLVIKEVDNKNFLPFWFGHTVEKILYPRDIIYTRSREEWTILLNQLSLSYAIEQGSPLFPDSTIIFKCKK